MQFFKLAKQETCIIEFRFSGSELSMPSSPVAMSMIRCSYKMQFYLWGYLLEQASLRHPIPTRNEWMVLAKIVFISQKTVSNLKTGYSGASTVFPKKILQLNVFNRFPLHKLFHYLTSKYIQWGQLCSNVFQAAITEIHDFEESFKHKISRSTINFIKIRVDNLLNFLMKYI